MLNSPHVVDYRSYGRLVALLAAVKGREKCVKELEKDWDTLVESWAGLVPKAFQRLTGEERNRIYQMLRLEATPVAEGYKVTGALGGFCTLEPTACARPR